MVAARIQDVDHGWSWFILFGGCVTQAIYDGVRQSSGIFYSEFLDTMSLSPPQAATVIAVLNGMFMLPAPLVSLLANVVGLRATIILGAFLSAAGFFGSSYCYSFWPLLLVFGALIGTGNCMTFIPVMGGFPLWFKKYRQLAPALVMTSGAIGIFIFAPVIQLLIDTYSWRGAVFVISGLVLQAAWVGASFFPAKLPESSKPAQAKNSPNPSLFNNLSFWLHLVHGFLIFGVPLFLIFIVRHVVEHRGFTAQEAAFLVSICGATSFFGRFLAVAITFNKRTGTKAVRFSLFNLASLFAAVASGLIPFLWDYRVIATVCATMGAMQGLKLSTMIGVTLDITTPPAFQTGYAFFHFVGGISIFAAPPLAGFLAQRYHSYDPCFYLSASALLLSYFVGLFVHFLEARKDQRRARLAVTVDLSDKDDYKGTRRCHI